jgi:hypothetical protein
MTQAGYAIPHHNEEDYDADFAPLRQYIPLGARASSDMLKHALTRSSELHRDTRQPHAQSIGGTTPTGGTSLWYGMIA